jgi:DNA-binding winged helix-turn-helix (wHTH) protein
VIFQFGTFELETVSGELRQKGSRVGLADKPFQLLKLLVENRGTIVNREQVKERLWGSNTFVDFEGNLGVILAKLRKSSVIHQTGPCSLKRSPAAVTDSLHQ